MKDIMLDLETLGTSNNAVIIQLGACYFDRVTGEIGEKLLVNISPESCIEAGLTMDASTVKWWIQQSKEAQNTLFKADTDLFNALENFSKFAKKAKAIWSHATFDFVILMNAYKKSGRKPSFYYRSARDIRTLVDLGRPTEAKREGIHHNALDDCLFQVKYVVEAINNLRSKQ